jgi:hypothetical protein
MSSKDEALKMAIEALNKLARLGNGDSYGNSDGNCIAIKTLKAIEETLEQPAQERLTTLDEIFADEMFRLNRDIMPLPEHLIHEIAQRNFHPSLGINPITFTLDVEKAHGIGGKSDD